jgi:hypothetical protein
LRSAGGGKKSERMVNRRYIPDVAYRILFNIDYEVEHPEVTLFSEMLRHFRTVNIQWDMTIMSHGEGKGQQRPRAVEIVLYRNDTREHEIAKKMLIDFLKSEGIPYRLLSEVFN